VEYGARSIRVNSPRPGPIKSGMAEHLFAIQGVEAVFAPEVPLGRIGLPEDYANAVLWVSSSNQLTRIPRPDEIPGGEDSYDVNKVGA